MAAVTKNLCFGITQSTTFETPFLLAKRLSTLDHLTDGRIGWYVPRRRKERQGLIDQQEHCDFMEEDRILSDWDKNSSRARRALCHGRGVYEISVQALGR